MYRLNGVFKYVNPNLSLIENGKKVIFEQKISKEQKNLFTFKIFNLTIN